MVTLSSMQEEFSAQDQWDFSDLSALFINTTLKGPRSHPTPRV